MKAARLALSLAGVLTLSACSSLNPFSSEGKPPALKPLTSPVGMSVSWRARVDEAGVFVFQPAVVSGAVFAVGKDGEVARIESGRTVWKMPLKTTVSGGVGSDGGPPSTPRCWLRRRCRTAWSWCAVPTAGCSVWMPRMASVAGPTCARRRPLRCATPRVW